MWDDITSILIYFAEKLPHQKSFIEMSTTQISKEVDLSQQSVSRKLTELEKIGLIKRHGSKITLTDKALHQLNSKYYSLKRLFADHKIIASVQTGLGEGSYYMSQPGYIKQFSILGYKPFPGTLNVKVNPAALEILIKDRQKIKINGFKTSERTFGGLIAYPITIKHKKSVSGHIIFPERTTHSKHNAELISSVKLRDHLNLTDNMEIELR